MSESTDESGAIGRRDLSLWFEGPLGRSVQALEANRLRAVLSDLSGTFAVQLGQVGNRDLLESSPTAVHLMVDPDVLASPTRAAVQAMPEALPLDTKSIQVILLPHTLDTAQHPHQVLREAHRVLAPEGVIVILGFNPFSVWGIWCLLRGKKETRPWCSSFIGLLRLKDWLSLLDFELTQGSMLYYRPPIHRQSLMDRLFFLERIGDRWWPLGAAVYLVVAKKRTPGLTRIMPVVGKRRLRAVSQPVGIRHG